MDVAIDKPVDLVFADYVYNNLDFSWVDKYWNYLQPNGIFIAMTDDSSIAEMKIYLDKISNRNKVSLCIYKQEWGGVPRKGFPSKHDYILIYAKGKDYKWYGDRIQIPKVTAGTKFDKKGTGMKTPCSVFDDLGNFSTMSKERIKTKEGKNVRWQKPLKLLNRLMLPFTDDGDLIVDPFMGVASLGEWCKKNNRNYIGVEDKEEIFQLGEKRIKRI